MHPVNIGSAPPLKSATRPPTPLDSAFCNVLWSACQRLNHISSVQFSYVAAYAPLVSAQIVTRRVDQSPSTHVQYGTAATWVAIGNIY